jgi:hypothetical protein
LPKQFGNPCTIIFLKVLQMQIKIHSLYHSEKPDLKIIATAVATREPTPRHKKARATMGGICCFFSGKNKAPSEYTTTAPDNRRRRIYWNPQSATNGGAYHWIEIKNQRHMITFN